MSYKVLSVLLLLFLSCEFLWSYRPTESVKDQGDIELSLFSELFPNQYSVQRILLKFGSPQSMYLSGEEDDPPHAREKDQVVLLFKKRVNIQSAHECLVKAFVDSNTYRIREIDLLFVDSIGRKVSNLCIDEVLNVYGKETRQFGVKDYETETFAQHCITEKTDLPSKCWIFKKLGMEVITIKQDSCDYVSTISFNSEARKGSSSLPKFKEE